MHVFLDPGWRFRDKRKLKNYLGVQYSFNTAILVTSIKEEKVWGIYLKFRKWLMKWKWRKDQRAKPQRAKPQSPPNPPIRIHCTNGNYAYLTQAVLWGQSKLKTLFHRYGDQADARARREDVTISGSDAECEGPWRSCMYFLILPRKWNWSVSFLDWEWGPAGS